MFVNGWNDAGLRSYGNHHYSEKMYKEEDGFFSCPTDLVTDHKETLNKSIKSGEFDQVFKIFTYVSSNYYPKEPTIWSLTKSNGITVAINRPNDSTVTEPNLFDYITTFSTMRLACPKIVTRMMVTRMVMMVVSRVLKNVLEYRCSFSVY